MATSDAMGYQSARIRFFVPEWDDHVDPGFDFDSDRWSGVRAQERGDKYAHELFPEPPYDGILVSLAQIAKKKGVLKKGAGQFSPHKSVREQLRMPAHLKLMGDCGAFTYLSQSRPPFTPEEAAELYGQLDFDIGASVDHVVFPGMTRANEFGWRTELTRRQLLRRVRITTENAERFIRARNKGGWQFQPMAVIQALDADHFRRKFLEYVDMGYRYVALGGLVPKKTNQIIRTIKAVGDARSSYQPAREVQLHLFGVVRQELNSTLLKENGVTSFDSASYLRKAWLRSDKNYATVRGEWYAAIRVPFAGDPRLGGNGSIEKLERLEQRCLRLLIEYDRNGNSAAIEDVLPEVLEYDRLLLRKSDNGNGLEAAYRRTLEDQPWKQCSCTMCAKLGIHIAIFRGINRNRRRGFHNLWVLKQQMADTSGSES